MQIFTESVITIIKNIPYGQVMTYGEIAKLAGNAKASRQVARVLNTMTAQYNLPWQRVVNRNYQVSIKNEMWAKEQMILLQDEGHVFSGRKIILKN